MKKKVLRINDNCKYESLDEEMIILNQDNGKYYELNKTGQFIFKLIVSNFTSIEILIEKVRDAYPDSANENDIHKFIDDLIERKILLLD